MSIHRVNGVAQSAPPCGQQQVLSQVDSKPQSDKARQLDEPYVLIVSVRRSVAIAKLTEFEHQAFRLGEHVSMNVLPRPLAADALYDVAIANDLTSIHGDDLIQAIIAAGLSIGGTHE
ncbi:MAG: hypothetical protein WBA48_00730 [Xanthobacteraceae bacterium]